MLMLYRFPTTDGLVIHCQFRQQLSKGIPGYSVLTAGCQQLIAPGIKEISPTDDDFLSLLLVLLVSNLHNQWVTLIHVTLF